MLRVASEPFFNPIGLPYNRFRRVINNSPQPLSEDSGILILTIHPEGKQGVNISKEKYDIVKKAIIITLHEKGILTFTKLGSVVKNKLWVKFEGSIN